MDGKGDDGILMGCIFYIGGTTSIIREASSGGCCMMNSWYGCYIFYDDWQVVSVCVVDNKMLSHLEDHPLSFPKRVNALGTQGCRVWWHRFKAE